MLLLFSIFMMDLMGFLGKGFLLYALTMDLNQINALKTGRTDASARTKNRLKRRWYTRLLLVMVVLLFLDRNMDTGSFVSLLWIGFRSVRSGRAGRTRAPGQKTG